LNAASAAAFHKHYEPWLLCNIIDTPISQRRIERANRH
jgi:hypothetical protein